MGKHNHKLSEEQVWAIYKDRRTPLKVVAYDHGVGISTVWNIQNKKIWKDIIAKNILVEERFRRASAERKTETGEHNG